MLSFFGRMLRRWRNRAAKCREDGRLDGKRAIPHVGTEELPERLHQLEGFGNQEISHLAEKSTEKLSRLSTWRKTLVEILGVHRKAHADSTQETTQRQGDQDQARTVFFAFHRRPPTYSGWWPVVITVGFIGLTVSADNPLNLLAFSQLGENEYVTQMVTLVFTIILMLVAHTTGALFRSDNPAAKWTGRFLGAVSLGFIIALSWMRKDAISHSASLTFIKLDPTFMFVFYLCLQILIFALAVVVGYWLHEPLQHDFNKKAKAVRGARKAERKAQMKTIATGQALQTAWDAECNADHVYVHRDQELRDRVQELRAIYLRANRAVRSDLEDGKLPKAYTKPLNLIRPQALEDALNRINGRKKITAA